MALILIILVATISIVENISKNCLEEKRGVICTDDVCTSTKLSWEHKTRISKKNSNFD